MYPSPRKVVYHLKSWLERNKLAPTGEDEDDTISGWAPVVLTGGHGGAVPAFIVWLARKIFKS